MQSSNVPDVDVSTQLSTATPTTSLNGKLLLSN